MREVIELHAFMTSLGARVYQIPIEAFPGLWTFAYLVIYKDLRVLIDTGSGFGDSNHQLIDGIQKAGSIASGHEFSFEDLTHVLITHGHIDHFGGLLEITSKSNALVGIHELDRRKITNFEESSALSLRSLNNYLIKVGVDPVDRENLLGLFQFTKQLFRSIPINFTYDDIDNHLGDFEFLHVPGHCAGQVVIRLHDILFCGDHILTDITPHQAPEELSAWTGLDHYLHSLDLVETWATGIRLALCGHKKVITDLPSRINEIREMHQDRLQKVMEFFRSPQTIYTLSKFLFNEANGYNALLAIEEAGAHVEYLHQRGQLVVENYKQVESASTPVSHIYRCQP
jgi:glyoxylase-like metal-dependent hydrolase (beta-lactamase superfamily II)